MLSKNDQKERLDGDGADERELSRVETICQTGKVAMLGNLPILVIIFICYQEKNGFHLCQTWKTSGSNPAIYRTTKRNALPQKIMSLI